MSYEISTGHPNDCEPTSWCSICHGPIFAWDHTSRSDDGTQAHRFATYCDYYKKEIAKYDAKFKKEFQINE